MEAARYSSPLQPPTGILGCEFLKTFFIKVFRSQTIEERGIDKCLPSSEVVGKQAGVFKYKILIYALIRDSFKIRYQIENTFLFLSETLAL